jgi:hypothetical protein
MARRFKYRSHSIVDEKDPYPAAPRIPIVLEGKKGSFETLAIIDSGATETSLPLWVSEILGLDIKEEIEVKFADKIGKGFESKVTIIIEMEHGKKIECAVPCIILDKGDEVILGRAGFFNNFEITFREYKKEVILKHIIQQNYALK